MNEQEAIDVLKDDNTCIGTLNCDDEAYKKLTPAKELAIAALEKQIPKKPVWNCNNEVVHCPSCDYDLMGGIDVDSEQDPSYCWECGQRLDWSD